MSKEREKIKMSYYTKILHQCKEIRIYPISNISEVL